MVERSLFALCGLLLSLPCTAAEAQRASEMRGSRATMEIVSRFDGDGNGRLDEAERVPARAYIKEQAPRRGPLSSIARTPAGRSNLAGDLAESAAGAVPAEAGLYDGTVLRTLYLRFASEDWYEELQDFYDTGVEVPADLVVDGKLYPATGVRFRGNSSYAMIGDSLKKPFALSLDYEDAGQRLYGYRTLNLLNGNADPSMLREVLFSHIAGRYLPVPKAGFVKLVVNGDSWGIYVNVQQINKDFTRDWFGATGGVRWKVPARGMGGSGGDLSWLGSDPAAYRASYEIMSEDSPEAWQELVRLCEILGRTSGEGSLAELEEILDVDGALWAIALESVFVDGDGYLSRGSDYSLYQDSGGRFHVIPYDNNETFTYAGRGGPNSWPTRDRLVSPLLYEGSTTRPLVSRLLAVPSLRERYLAHVRTIMDDWLSWEAIGPLVASLQGLIDEEVRRDDKALYGYEAFREAGAGSTGAGGSGGWGGAPPSLRTFVTQRLESLNALPELSRAAPVVRSVSGRPAAGEGVEITALVSTPFGAPGTVLLRYATGPLGPFRSTPMRGEGGFFTATIPALPGGARLRYYVEARSASPSGSTSFEPPGAERGALSYSVPAEAVAPFPVVLNELMARNSRAARDPQREFDDWIELYNASDLAVELGGLYLTDKEGEPRKWRFPAGSSIPPRGYLVVWADEDTGAAVGLHASFKLSGEGEILQLVDRDERGNRILDSVRFGPQEENAALGRYPDGTGAWTELRATLGKRNQLR